MDYLTVEEAGSEIGLPRSYLLNRISRKKIEAVKRGWMWMIPQSEVDRIKKELTAEASYQVYLHKLPNDKVIWVGMSKVPDRAYEVQPGRHGDGQYDAFLKRYGRKKIQVEIVKDRLTELDARILERDLICRYRAEGHPLTNYRSPR